MSEKFYSMEKIGSTLELYIFGEITSLPLIESDVSEHSIISQIANADVDLINVHLSSYGGEVKSGVAIYNALKEHKAKVRTIADSLVCSIASVIFMAGDERIMKKASALMVHDAWNYGRGNAAQLRKMADDLDKVTQLSVIAYVDNSALSEDEVRALMMAETYIMPEEALEYGFATAIEESKNAHASQNAIMSVLEIIKEHQQKADKQVKDTDEDEEKPETDTEETPTDEGEDTEEEETDDNSEEETPETSEKGEEKPHEKINNFFNAILKI